ncbi:MAG: oxidoreductase [Propionicimonas sp.]|uniref:globin domain-containing protein n=1 Tax=Propionicimonas sp. TaxID=1955623 RepID=UPI003D0C588C
MQTVYEAAGGAQGLLALATAWHERCLADPVANHPFTHHPSHPQHLERLAAYWGEALGGPPAYTAGLGTETRVLKMHAGNGEHRDLDAAAIACFDLALDDVGLRGPVRAALHDYFATSTHRMGEHPDSPASVPGDAVLPHWGWAGPASA